MGITENPVGRRIQPQAVKTYIETVKAKLDKKTKHREIVAEKEPEVAYNTHFDSKKCVLSSKNIVTLE